MDDPGRGGPRPTRQLVGWLVAALVVLGVPALMLGSCSTRESCETNGPAVVAQQDKQWYGVGDVLGVCV